MTDRRPPPDQDSDLPPMPGPGAGPDEWRLYHEALFKAGKLTSPQGNDEPAVKVKAR